MFKKLRLDKPIAATAKEWRVWHAENRKKYPIRYFLTQSLPRFFTKIRNKILADCVALKQFFYFRFIDKHHVIKTDLKPGWHNFDEKILHVNFQLLVDYVELYCAWNEGWKPSLWKLITKGANAWRCREMGLKHLSPHAVPKSISDDNPHAKQISKINQVHKDLVDLYIWWKDVRPNRRNPYESVSWKNFHANHEGENIWDWMESDNKEAVYKLKQASEEAWILEDSYEKEDQEQLMKLISLRKYLWA